MLTDYQRQLRQRLLNAPVVPAPSPWRRPDSVYGIVAVGGLVGVGFAVHPDTGADVLMVVSHDGHGLVDPLTYEKLARNPNPDPERSMPDNADLTCPGLGPVAGMEIRIAGLFGGGLNATTADGWGLD